jgi:hypothetical protein
MKKLIYRVMSIIVMIIFAGCGAPTKEIARMSQSVRNDVFAEMASEGPAPAGYADLVIRASLKTPPAGYYLFESKVSSHGKAVETFLINIDGQAVLWQAEGRKYVLPEYVDDKTSRDPEAGEGMKYMLERKVRLAAGSHKVFFGLPDEPYYTTADISVNSSGSYVLEFKPEYRYKTAKTRIPTFLNGIAKFEVLFKEVAVRNR